MPSYIGRKANKKALHSLHKKLFPKEKQCSGHACPKKKKKTPKPNHKKGQILLKRWHNGAAVNIQKDRIIGFSCGENGSRFYFQLFYMSEVANEGWLAGWLAHFQLNWFKSRDQRSLLGVEAAGRTASRTHFSIYCILSPFNFQLDGHQEEITWLDHLVRSYQVSIWPKAVYLPAMQETPFNSELS